MVKLTDVVSWAMKDDLFLKLENAGKTYEISEEVGKFLKSKGLFDEIGDGKSIKLDNKTVDVEIDESTASGEEGESAGTITRLVLSNSKPTEKPAETEPQDSPKSNTDDLVVKELTVGGVSAKGGVKFKEDKENDTWYDLDSTIDVQKFKKECTGKEVEITVLPQDKGNDVIKGYVVKEEEKVEEKKEEPKKSYKGTGNSIEAQASLKCAKSIVSALIPVLPIKDANDVLAMITKIATHAYQTIQDLKNKG